MDNVEVEVKKQLNYLRSLQSYLSESSANPKDFAKIIDIYKNPIHRILKLNCYPLLKTFPSSELVCLELEKDFSNKDYEIQLLSLKLAYSLPISNLMQIVKSYDTAFYQIIEQSSDFHYERLCAVNSILQLLLTKETEVDSIDMPKQTITNIYLRIAENCFSNNRDISANCIICLSEFLQSKLQNPNNLTQVNYDNQQIKQYLLCRIQLLYEKICSYEIRIRSKMLFLLSQILLDSPKQIQQQNTIQQNQNTQIYKLNVMDFNNKIIKAGLYDILQYNFEIDIIVQISNFLINIISQCKSYEYFNTGQIVWQLFDCIDKYIKKVNYKKELNQILLQILQLDMDLNTNIAISIRILEISFLIQNQLTRLLFLLYCFSNLIQKSIELLYQKKTSAILGLYNQTWFLTKIKDEPEELICCLIIAAIHQETNKSILLEIMEICNAFIWDGCNIEAIIMYLLLIEECINVIPSDEIRLDDLINRMNTNQISFNQKVQTLLIITRKFNENSLNCKLDYINILAEFRTFMIQPVQTQICQLNLLQNVYKILYYLSINFHTPENHIKQQILELLSDYNDNLQQRKNDHIAEQLIEYNRNFVKSLQYKEFLQQDQLQIKINNQIDSINQNLQNLTTYQIAYNIFQQKQFSSEQNTLIMNLRSLQLPSKNIFTELQLNSKLITGVSDFVQIYCSHTLDLQKSCICLGIRVINNCPFKLDNLGIKILLDRNSYIQNNYKLIEELPSYQEKQLFYVVKVNPKLSMHFAFDIILQDIKNESSLSFAIRTQNYRISMLEFLIPNTFLYLSQNCFQYITYDTSLIIKCYLEGNYLQLYKKLLSQPFATVILDNTNQVFQYSIKQNLNLDLITQNVSKTINIGLLSYLINGQNLAIIISNISTQQNSTEVLLEIKSDKSCIESFQTEIDKFLFELSDGLLSVVL
ncbi:unnamed protein product [Paramecium pentaurelia]|uniref:Uncharacterized protein n=1 Tax=Paramecium pentaurelia TaxID=43138 RepID=A0A8S1UUQ4_9CILI|nr:unnamed protein product [Paramecium pentaurelia]